MGQDLYFEKFVEASTPKFGEWAERWDSREPCTIVLKPFYYVGFARIISLVPLVTATKNPQKF